MENSGLIHFRCVAPTHNGSANGRVADTLTIVEGRWGFCAFDVNGNDHRWEATGGVAIEMLRRGTPDMSVVLDVRPRPSSPEPAAHAPSRKTSKRTYRTG